MEENLGHLGNINDECDFGQLQDSLEELYFENPDLADEIHTYISETAYLSDCYLRAQEDADLAEAEYGDGDIECRHVYWSAGWRYDTNC